jgi:hypothetical protein
LACALGIWMILDRDHRAVLGLAILCVSVGSIDVGWRLVLRSVEIGPDDPDREGR